jgi:hypothetical protein
MAPLRGFLALLFFGLQACAAAKTPPAKPTAQTTSQPASQPASQSVSQSPPKSTPQPAEVYGLIRQGLKLPETEAQALEKQLLADPNDLSARIKLLSYYSTRQFQSKEARGARQGHVLWIIEHAPENEIAGTPYCSLIPALDDEVYERAVALWRKQLQSRPEDVAVLGNAARFFLLPNPEEAQTLLEKARALDPKNPKWAKQLGHLHALGSNNGSAKERRASARQALLQYEDAYQLTSDEEIKLSLLPDIAKMAFASEYWDKAKGYAEELLRLASAHQASRGVYGNAVHHGNLILGRLALLAGDTAGAKSYLLAAGKTPGSPQLNSFGPNMALAQELLEVGESQVVLEYFALCAVFWKSGQGELDMWTRAVKDGKKPDFGANLVY